MITLILILLLIVWIISTVVKQKTNWPNRYNWWAGEIVKASSSGLIIFLMPFLLLLVAVISGRTIDSKIELYQAQDVEIESKIQVTVASYLVHEHQTYKDLKPDNAIAVVLAYPELHSNELVKKQIEVYENNNKKIIELKEEKLNQPVYKWWLYFGR
jgi:hypothetical protein